MFFSEKSRSPLPAFSNWVSIVAIAANAQHEPTAPWSLMLDTQPMSRESHFAGNASGDVWRSRARYGDLISRTRSVSLLGDGLKPVVRSPSPYAGKPKAPENAAARIIPKCAKRAKPVKACPPNAPHTFPHLSTLVLKVSVLYITNAHPSTRADACFTAESRPTGMAGGRFRRARSPRRSQPRPQ